MRPATAYSKCYILYLFVAVILLSLTSLHMCVVVAAEEPLEENVVAELKQKAGEVEALAGGVKEANEEMVTSAREVVNLLNTATQKINEAKEEHKEEQDEWAKTLKATNSAKESADEAVEMAEKIQTAANKAGGAMQKMAAQAKDILSNVKNMRSLIGKFRNETDMTVSLWGEVSSDDVQSLLDITSAVVEKTNKAKEEAETVLSNIKKNTPLEKKTNEATSEKEKVPQIALDKKGQAHSAAKKDVNKPDVRIETKPEKKVAPGAGGHPKQALPKPQPAQTPSLPNARVTATTSSSTESSPSSFPSQSPGPSEPSTVENAEEAALTPNAAPALGQPTPQQPEPATTVKPVVKKTKILLEHSTKKMRLMQNEMVDDDIAAEEVQQNNKIKNKKVVESLGEAVEKAMKLKETVYSVKEKISNARQLSQEVAQLVDTVIKMRESKELSVLPSSFGSLVFVVNNICLTTFVTLTYVFGNTL